MCLTFIFDEGYILAQTDQSSSPKSSLKAKKKKRLKKRKKKTPRLILKKFSRDSLRIEQAFKKELLKLKRSSVKKLNDAEKGYTPEVKSEIERDNNVLKALIRDSGRLIKVLKYNIQSLKSGLGFLGEAQKLKKAEIYDQISQYEFDVQILDTTAKIINKGILLDSTLSKL